MRVIFQIEDKPYNFRHKFLVKSKNVKSVNYGAHTRSFLGSRICDTKSAACQNTVSLGADS